MSSRPTMAHVDNKMGDNNDTHLWVAVMDRAVRDLVALEKFRQQDPEILSDPVFRYDYRSLKKWFYSSSMEPGKFNWICSLVDIDPKWAIAKLEDKLNIVLTKKKTNRDSLQSVADDSKAVAA
ncbi:MAG: hypothetical protein HQL70_01560 [Magnetococcales bacterium]|nr:hypothetical protein [Magnetococcales bacterium]